MRQNGEGRRVKKPAVFLDRDGVLNVPCFSRGRSYAPRRFEDFELYDDAYESVCRLKNPGYIVVVVTNQPDVGAGLIDIAVVEKMHEYLRENVPIDDIEVCYDTREQASSRRKPEPGMLFDAAAKLNIDLADSYMVGDRAGDIQAAIAAGVTPIFIDHNYTEPRPVAQIQTVFSLKDAVDVIMRLCA